MAWCMAHNLIHGSFQILSRRSPRFGPCYRFFSRGNWPSRSGKGQLIEVEIEADSDVEVLGLRRLEDAIHGVVVRRLAPEWLPFLPGSSYWVPPRKRSLGVLEVIEMANSPLTEEESLSLTTVRGWPSLAYFIEGGSPHPSIKSKSKNKATESEDEEG